MEIYLVGGGAFRRPATLFARSFGGEGCSLLPMPPSEREGDHGRVPESECNELLGFVRVVEGACAILKFLLSSALRTLPQSLRDSSLPEGASEMFAAVRLVRSVRLSRTAEDVCPYNE